MRILITNDDGIHAPGLTTLERIANALTNDIWVVAPETEQSGAARSFTFSEPLRLRKTAPQRFALRGTPVDCVMLAVNHLMDEKPHLILSGVNRGQNLAEDVTYSGTIAGAMEGAMLGIPSLALSQAFSLETRHKPHWETAEHFAPEIIKNLVKTPLPTNVLLSLNFPDAPPDKVKGIKVTHTGKRRHPLFQIEKRIDPRGIDYYWHGFNRANQPIPEKGTDLRAIREGQISITPLHFDMTHYDSLKELNTLFKNGH